MLKFWKKKPDDETKAPPEVFVAETPTAALVETAIKPKPTWRDRFEKSVFNRDVRDLFARHPKLDDALLDELESVLLTADVGVNASAEIVESLRVRMQKREFADASALIDALRKSLLDILKPVAIPLVPESVQKPFVILMVGVNGVGKTTTIGKLARYFQGAGNEVILAAGDTFRAAAVEQLKMWGDRNHVAVISQGAGADSASVIFDALQSARARGADILIADTAGRLHTQGGLMDELTKIRPRTRQARRRRAARSTARARRHDGTERDQSSTSIQFGHRRHRLGRDQLDGTAKGGVVFALAKEFGLPIRFVGLGESVDDLREFDAAAFVDGLLPANLGNAGS